MKYLNWNSEKNEILKQERGIYFEETAYYLRLTADIFPDISIKLEGCYPDIIPRLEGNSDETY